MALIQFTRNYSDLSTDRGFQFEFKCDRCGNGYETRFEPTNIAAIGDIAEAAGNLLGGLFGSAANMAEGARSSAWQKAHDDAFVKAVNEAQPHFHKCKRCGHWVDNDCWNTQRQMCKDCAPDLQEEYSSIQTQAAINDAQMKAAKVEYTTADQFKQTIAAHCPNCGASLEGSPKFCPNCGQALATKKFCTSCGKELAPGAKFCAECGAAQS